MAKIINLFGGPGAGKSKLRADLFSSIKEKSVTVEEIHEFAKELTYKGDTTTLYDPVLMLGKQHHMQKILDPIVDFIVTDSPFIMGLTYVSDDLLYKDSLYKLSLDMHHSYDNINIVVKRNPKFEYQQFGRNQTPEESNEKHDQIIKFLDDNRLPYIIVMAGEDAVEIIKDLIDI